MDFSLSESLQQQLKWAEQFVQTNIVPIELKVLHSNFTDQKSEIASLQQQVKEQGLWAPHMPLAVGGAGFDLVALGLLSEVLGQSPLGHLIFGCQAPDAGNMELLHHFATPSQQQQWLQPLIAGTMRSCFGMTEPSNAGSNPTLLQTEAKLDGDHWVLNGRKWFTSSADGAGFCIVMAVTDKTAPHHQRASMFLVPTDQPGYQRLRNIPVMGDVGSGYFSHSEIELDNCRIPAENLLGQQGDGFAMAQTRLGPGRIHHCMRWIGVAKRALNELIAYTQQRQISRHAVLSDMQTVQTWAADSAAEIAAARALVLQTAWQVQQLGFKAVRSEVSMIKYFTANVLQTVLDRTVQGMGALGMTDDTIIAFLYRHERAARIYDGPDEVHKNVVAKHLWAEQSNALSSAQS
ncbi:MAG: acyl-CoA dehydrogenase family protein [Gammaproteobacteria bacterium]|nr:acyl-CoA dehydrogenase family protein [Gammaproteobacteria bacterium]NVK87530.1 acyl-CoA dehydrogenase family protein [Gammaproteobacteria bacterium]